MTAEGPYLHTIGFIDASDMDYYRLSLSERQEVTISLSTTSRHYSFPTPSNMTIRVTVLDVNQNKIGGFTSQVSNKIDTKLNGRLLLFRLS